MINKTLREHYAGLVINGVGARLLHEPTATIEEVVKIAVEVADRLIRELKESQEKEKEEREILGDDDFPEDLPDY